MPRTFTLVRTLGRGAHGAVHLAEMRDDDDYVQTLAIKRLLPEWSTDRDLVARLKDEARLLALLGHHEHVVRVHGLIRIDGSLAILMEPIDGVDLGKVVAHNGALPPRITLEIVRAVADALDAVWTAAPTGGDALRVVHRDIKPSNVMLTPRGAVKVMDFGVARADFESREGETRSQQFGTARYMAPERWMDGLADHRSDVFSLGVTLIEIASGSAVARFRLSREPFDEDVAAALATIKWEPLRALAGRMTAFAVADRPTAAEVVAACDALLRDAPGPDLRTWAPDGVVVGTGEPVDPTVAATVVREDSGSRSARAVLKRDNRGWYALFAAGLVFGIALLWLGEKPNRHPPAPVPAPPPVPAPVQVLGTAAPEPKLVVPKPEPPPPIPVPTRPRPAPAAPTPVPVAEPAPVPSVDWTFIFEDGITKVDTAEFGAVTESHRKLSLPRGKTVHLTVTESDGHTFPCTVTVGNATGNVVVGKGGKCHQSSS